MDERRVVEVLFDVTGVRDSVRRAEPEPTLVPRLWTTFAAAWLLVLVITTGQLAREPLSAGRHAATYADLVLLAALYLWLTVRIAPRPDADEKRPALGAAQRIAAVIGIALLVVPLVLLVPAGGMWWHVIYAVVAAGLALTPRMAAAAIAALVVVTMFTAHVVTGVLDLRLLILLAIGGAATAVRLLAIVATELREARTELSWRAADAERLRIARDLHDGLGHSLSLIVLKAQVARRVAESRAATLPVEASNELREIERAARDALQQVRAVVTDYRHPTLQGELAAARELLSASGMRIIVEDDVGPLPPRTQRLLAWTVREAVTNVIRHSRARECVIQTRRDGECATVTVVDDGFGVADDFVAGSGLTGLAERAKADAGRVTFGPALHGGFSVSLAVPIGSSGEVE